MFVIARSEATKQSILLGNIHGLLRFARNDGITQPIKAIQGEKSSTTTRAPKYLDPFAARRSAGTRQQPRAATEPRRHRARLVCVDLRARGISPVLKIPPFFSPVIF